LLMSGVSVRDCRVSFRLRRISFESRIGFRLERFNGEGDRRSLPGTGHLVEAESLRERLMGTVHVNSYVNDILIAILAKKLGRDAMRDAEVRDLTRGN